MPTREDAGRLHRALRFYLPDARVALFPADDRRPWDAASPDPHLPAARLAALGHDGLVVAPAKALLYRVPAERAAFPVARGDVLDPATLVAWLVARGYHVAQAVEEPATVSVRGGVIEVWASGSDEPVRIELFDDEVESLRRVDPATRRPAKSTLSRVLLPPAREAVLDEASVVGAAAYVHAVALERGHQGPYRRVVTDLRNGVWFPGAEDYLPAFGPTEPVVPRPPLYVLEPERVASELEQFERQVEERLDHLPPEDRPLVRPFDRYLRAHEARLDGAIPVRRLALRDGDRALVDFACVDNQALRAGAELEPVVRRLRALAAEGRAVRLVVEGDAHVERVRALFAAHELALPEAAPGPRRIVLQRGDLPEGYTSATEAVVTAGEIFGEKLGAPAPERATSKLRRATRRSFAQVKRGDFVVHARHGVGLFAGLARLPLGLGEGDFAMLEYRDGQRLYVPLDRLDLLTPWQATDGAPPPKLDKLGGATWEARKSKVRDAVLRLASELLLLYARQKLAQAPVLDHGDELYWRFAEAFPYVETPDQEAAIGEVLTDLASGHPMDRLLLGDVGFGKTEVAMRAAMVAVLGGRQVAVLCPTSVLALQHVQTFRRRFAGFPVQIAGLSRLSTDDRAVRAGCADGSVDVVIGTTALLSTGLRWKKLGLVVIDEEHRFGTRQKEELRRRAAGVHLLALSATPIPRTLQMSLSGLRTLSVLTTPPPNRQRIRTEVVRFAPERIREDILYELRRGGQVYFVHNRVQSIDKVAHWLRRLVPEATFVVAHGQQSEHTLERALATFIRGEANVLVSTAIIESGVDLPLVNTMIINRAELFGLAQLYQLRGRIGRGDVRGHCTVLVAGAGEGREASAERLRALQEHDELGANFQLASRDLELRGSGEILGERQHGHIAAIGFDAYLELLDEAVARARGELVRVQLDPEVEVAAVAVLPESWIPDVPERLEAYQHIALCRTRTAVRGELARLEARYGEPPPEARNLGWLAEARLRCRELGIDRFKVAKVRAVLHLHPSSPVKQATVEELLTSLPSRFRRVGDDLEVRITPEEGQLPFRVIDWVCGKLDIAG